MIGVDSSPEMLAVARAAAEAAGVSERLDLRVGDLREPPVSERVPLVDLPVPLAPAHGDRGREAAGAPRRARAARARTAASSSTSSRRAARTSRRRTTAGSSASPGSSSAPSGTRARARSRSRCARATTSATLRPALAVGAGVAPPARARRASRSRRSTAGSTGGLRGRGGHDLRLPPRRLESARVIWLLVLLGIVVLLAIVARRPLQPARPAAERRRQRVGAGRGAAQAALGSDPEPRRDRQGLRGARARDVRGRHAGARARAAGGDAGRDRAGRGHPRRGARPPLRGRRGVPGAPGRRELPPAPDRARRDREPGRGLAPGLQRRRADVQQRDPDLPRPRDRRAVQLHRFASSSRSRRRRNARCPVVDF